jgi:transposase
MPPEFDILTREQLAQKLVDANFEIHRLKQRVSWFERQMFGRKSERYIPTDSSQLTLDLGATAADAKEQEVKLEKVASYARNRKAKSEEAKQPVRMPLPAHLRREVITVPLECDLSDKVKIGEEVSEYLEEKPGEVYVVRTVREVYATKKNPDAGVVIAPLPPRALARFNVGTGMLALIIIRKYVDHLPVFRQLKIYRRSGLELKESTLHGWIKAGADLLVPLYERMVAHLLARSYLQSDDTSFKVLEERGPHRKTPLGYMWVYQDPAEKLVVFSYSPRRTKENPVDFLKDYQGYLQTDGLSHYDGIAKRKGVAQLHCWAHARRKFEESLDNDFDNADEMMRKIQRLYEVERIARQGNFTHEQRLQLRQEKAVPVLNEIRTWLTEKATEGNLAPKSLIAEAIGYTLTRMESLSRYCENGMLEIDNNLAENSIRPIVLGRKNYLFAATHESAQRAAMIYSILATCRHHDINPEDYLKDVLDRTATHPQARLDDLLPWNWKTAREQTRA